MRTSCDCALWFPRRLNLRSSSLKPSVEPLGWVCPVGCTQDVAAAICNLLPGPRLFFYGWRQVRLWVQLATLSNVTAQFRAPSGSAGLACLVPPPQLPPCCLHPSCAERGRDFWISSVCMSFSQPRGSVLIIVTMARISGPSRHVHDQWWCWTASCTKSVTRKLKENGESKMLEMDHNLR